MKIYSITFHCNDHCYCYPLRLYQMHCDHGFLILHLGMNFHFRSIDRCVLVNALDMIDALSMSFFHAMIVLVDHAVPNDGDVLLIDFVCMIYSRYLKFLKFECLSCLFTESIEKLTVQSVLQWTDQYFASLIVSNLRLFYQWNSCYKRFNGAGRE